MKRYVLLTLLFLSAGCFVTFGARSYPHPKKITQPDGSEITLIGHGDEFCHFVTTTDGYSVVRGFDGIYRYAVEERGRLKPSKVKASDPESRPEAELNFLHSLKQELKPSVSSNSRRLMKLASKEDALFPSLRGKRNSKGRSAINRAKGQTFRGLVILVNFTDRKFSRGEMSQTLVNDMMNAPGRTSYIDPLLHGSISCTGSVRDYFEDNSGGLFIPEFDVAGPVEVNVDQYYIMTTERTYELCAKVLEAADAEVDYSRYDSDGDGMVDMLYVLYAGYSSVYQGNDERLVWPHAGHFADANIAQPVFDGMRFGRFACSSEIFGWQDDGDMFLDGIGVIVHEFSHVLGFKDHYDVSGYLNEDPGLWDVMASGNYNGNLNDTPCGYNSYEKYSAGFMLPRTVSDGLCGESISLCSISSSDDALRIESMQDSTIFLLENRQPEKWDKDLPGHGMLVWRVDSCDAEYWNHNALNVNGRLHFKLIRANGPTFNLFRELDDTDYDSFPGSRGVRSLTNSGKDPHLLSVDEYPSPFTIHDIEEAEGIVSFTVRRDEEAKEAPYTFSLCDSYFATGIDSDGTSINWDVRTGTVSQGGRERPMIFDLAPDLKGISSTDPKYADGLGAAYALSGDRRSVYIEPYRVAVTDDCGIWLVDFNDLDNGGSGAIVLDMNPYGEISLANPESVLGYCLLPIASPLVIAHDIVERFSMVRQVSFGVTSGVHNIPAVESSCRDTDEIFNLQGLRVLNPKSGEIYIIHGKKIIF